MIDKSQIMSSQNGLENDEELEAMLDSLFLQADTALLKDKEYDKAVSVKIFY